MSTARSNGHSEGVVGGLAGFGSDLATLAEFQAKLAALDMKDSVQQAGRPLAVALLGAAVALGAIPVALAGGALVLAESAQIRLGWAFVITGGVAVVLAAVVTAIAANRVPHGFQSFHRSREELNRNLNWIRTVLAHSGRPAQRTW